MNQNKRPFVSTSALVVLGRVGGMVLPFMIAYFYGAGPDTDGFFLAYNLIISIASLFNPVFELVLVPYLAEYKSDTQKVSNMANSYVMFCMPVVLLITAGVGFIAAPAMVYCSGLDTHAARLTIVMIFSMLPVVIFWIWSAGHNGIFYTYKSFWFPAISPLLRSLCVILFLLLGSRSLGVYAIAIGYSVGEVCRWLVGVLLLMRHRWWKFHIQWQESKARFMEFMRQAWYQVLALLAINLIPITDQWFASWYGSGNLSLMSYADRLFKIPYQFFLTGFLAIFLSDWSDNYFKQDSKNFWQYVKRDIRRVFLVTLVFSIVAAFLSRPIVFIGFGFGEFSSRQLDVLSNLFFWLILGFAPTALNLLYIRVLFVIKKSEVFCLQAWARFLLNIMFNYIFSRIWGLPGIVISTTFVYVVTTGWLYYYVENYRKKNIGSESGS